jgi:hypothetical protein
MPAGGGVEVVTGVSNRLGGKTDELELPLPTAGPGLVGNSEAGSAHVGGGHSG